MSNFLIDFDNVSNFFDDNLIIQENFFHLNDYSYFLYLFDYSNFNFLSFFNNRTEYANSLITFINQIDDLSFFQNLENIQTIYHYSIPNTKLAYPEPFIASASFMHSDL